MLGSKYLIILIVLILTVMPTKMVALAPHRLNITNYHQIFIPCHNQQDQLLIAIRMFYVDTTPYFLTVNPYNFKTQTMVAQSCAPSTKAVSIFPYHKMQVLQNTPYMQALHRYTSPFYKIFYKTQNYGMTHSEYPVKSGGMFLTIDMCPSHKLFEKDFFNALVAIANSNNRPVPIGLSVSGMWILGHPKEFAWLAYQQKSNTLQITWINHSFSHLYYDDLPLADNFLLTPQTNFTWEILDTEKLLLENHQLPSVFFRFPGLISNKNTVLALRKFGLIPIGSDAWLAKEEAPTAGSIILVHGNGNEPQGIVMMLSLLHQPNLLLLPLSEAFFN